MSIDLEFVDRQTYLHVVISGSFELEEAKRAFTKLMHGCVEHRPANLLVDLRQLAISKPISIRERFDFTVAAVRAAIDYRARGLSIKRTAFLGTSAHIDSRRFGETVAANRGVKIRATIDEAEALAWLGVIEGDIPAPQKHKKPVR